MDDKVKEKATVVITSENPVKVAAVKDGFKASFPNLEFEFIQLKVSSDVSDQPMSAEETHRGALNRASNAQKIHTDADFCVGLEGGLEEDMEGRMMSFSFVVVLYKDGREGYCQTNRYQLPPKVAELVKQGMELGQADDIVFKRENSKQSEGASGLLTHGIITRKMTFENGVILALVPFSNGELYE